MGQGHPPIWQHLLPGIPQGSWWLIFNRGWVSHSGPDEFSFSFPIIFISFFNIKIIKRVFLLFVFLPAPFQKHKASALTGNLCSDGWCWGTLFISSFLIVWVKWEFWGRCTSFCLLLPGLLNQNWSNRTSLVSPHICFGRGCSLLTESRGFNESDLVTPHIMEGIVFTGTTVTLVPSLANFWEDLSCSDRIHSGLVSKTRFSTACKGSDKLMLKWRSLVNFYRNICINTYKIF